MIFDYVTLQISDNFLDFSWGCELGFGHLITDWQFNIIDDECMGEKFCNKVIKEGMKNFNRFYEFHGGEKPLNI